MGRRAERRAALDRERAPRGPLLRGPHTELSRRPDPPSARHGFGAPGAGADRPRARGPVPRPRRAGGGGPPGGPCARPTGSRGLLRPRDGGDALGGGRRHHPALQPGRARHARLPAGGVRRAQRGRVPRRSDGGGGDPAAAWRRGIAAGLRSAAPPSGRLDPARAHERPRALRGGPAGRRPPDHPRHHAPQERRAAGDPVQGDGRFGLRRGHRQDARRRDHQLEPRGGAALRLDPGRGDRAVHRDRRPAGATRRARRHSGPAPPRRNGGPLRDDPDPQGRRPGYGLSYRLADPR